MWARACVSLAPCVCTLPCAVLLTCACACVCACVHLSLSLSLSLALSLALALACSGSQTAKAGIDAKTFQQARKKMLNGELQDAHNLMTSLTQGQNVNGYEYLARVRTRFQKPVNGKKWLEEEYARRLTLDTGIAEASFIVTNVDGDREHNLPVAKPVCVYLYIVDA